MASSSVAISIINYNSFTKLSGLLKEIMVHKNKRLEIWIVDNASPDQGGKKLKKQFPKINLIQSNENLGFAKGHNLALKQIKSDYVILLNPDVELSSNAIADMVKFMEDHPSCGVASCKILGFDNKLQSNGGDLPIGLPFLVWNFNLETLGLENIWGNFHRMDPNYYNRPKEVDWVGGTMMVVKKTVLDKVGGLPEDYFMYTEDVDFCYMVRKKGFKVMINPEVVIKHQGGGSSSDPRLAQFKGEIIGLEIFYLKYFGMSSVIILKLMVYLATILRIIAFGLAGKSSISSTYIKVLKYV